MSQKKSKIACSDTLIMDRTINLARGDDPKTKMLVYERKYPKVPFCGAQLPPGVKGTPKTATRIRICTAEDMVQACPPPMCTCPPIEPPLGCLGIIKNLLKFGIKSALAGAVVYWTYDIGIWGTADQTEELYTTMKEVFRGENPKDRTPGSPSSMDQKNYSYRDRWNRTVSKAFSLVNIMEKKLTPAPDDSCKKDKEKENEKEKDKAKKE